MSFTPTHRNIEATFTPLSATPIKISGNCDNKNHRFGVTTSNGGLVISAYEIASEEMVKLGEAWAATLEALGAIYNVRNVIRGDNYDAIIIALA